MNDLSTELDVAVAAGHLLASSAQNIRQLLARSSSPVDRAAIEELVRSEAWGELNDRFFRTLAFGTGGLRGRTIGKIVTGAEAGAPQPLGRPEYPCVGTNAMNYFNISRATQGLVAYLKAHYAREGRTGRPKLCIAHDTRHFSRPFAELCAKVAVENGCDALLFEAPRSTPELSFAVRHTHSDAGVVLTASHNPPHDNGFKCYFSDGAQVVEPHATGIIDKVNAIESDAYTPLPESERGTVRSLGADLDAAYMDRLETLILDPAMVRGQGSLRIVYSPIHGTGGVIIEPMLKRLGFTTLTVPAQNEFDGRFPTVASPNPENAEALRMAMELADKERADLVMATDPDCDRMGTAARDSAGKLQLLTGNQIGSLMAWYRAKTYFDQGILTAENAGHAVIIKTLVTSDLQKAIAQRFGLGCVETLTGFKYIGEKLGKYEAAIPANLAANYRELPEEETRKLRLQHSFFYVFGGEESYGYSGADFVRDKDANGATVMFAEVAAYAKSQGLTLVELLDQIYMEFGFYLERGKSMTMEGASGASQIQRLAASYASAPPRELDGVPTESTLNFSTQEIRDVEGDRLPSEKMLIITLADGRRAAVRPSGTEPKIKFYLFAHRTPPAGEMFGSGELPKIKEEVISSVDQLWSAIQKDVQQRIAN
ncbi:MAG TPA: phospho-sugar mutase [Chthoniobacteraceae bacterium]|jgi:phosphoglucomutase|nr:phospho-sugar mutase [Chthoniobacteraceae bacterium]